MQLQGPFGRAVARGSHLMVPMQSLVANGLVAGDTSRVAVGKRAQKTRNPDELANRGERTIRFAAHVRARERHVVCRNLWDVGGLGLRRNEEKLSRHKIPGAA